MQFLKQSFLQSKVNQLFLISCIGFTLLYILISIVNHYTFRTFALDLGLYTNAMWDYAHFQPNYSALIRQEPFNIISDHFDLYLLIFSPLIYIFDSYTLLVVQIAAIVVGAFGIRRYFNTIQTNPLLSLAATIYFFSFFAVFSALSFDFHSNVIAASILPWFFVKVHQNKWKSAFLILAFLLISKENFSLFLFFVCLGLAVQNYTNLRKRNILALASLICIGYFLTITIVVMPYIAYAKQYTHFDFSVLGSNFKHAITTLITKPGYVLQNMFINHTKHPEGGFIKIELLIYLAICGLPLLIKKPYFLWMIIPLIMQQFLNDNFLRWGVTGHYAMDYTPILTLGVFSVIASFKNNKLKNISMVCLPLLAIIVSARMSDKTALYVNKANIRFYQASHYKNIFHIKNAHKALQKIPKNASISAQSIFIAHLANRDSAFCFPLIQNAQYVLYSGVIGKYPISEKEFTTLTDSLENKSNYKIWFKDKQLTILKRP